MPEPNDAHLSLGERIGKRIRSARVESGRTQRDVAEAVGIGAPHVSKMEAGREIPSPELLNRIAAYFGVHPADLTGDLDIARARAWLMRSREQPIDLRDREAETVVVCLVGRVIGIEQIEPPQREAR